MKVALSPVSQALLVEILADFEVEKLSNAVPINCRVGCLFVLISNQNPLDMEPNDGFLKKLYQHRPQIAKTNFCVINVENSVMFARSSRQNSLLFSRVSG